MKRVFRYLFLLFTVFSLSSTAQAVPMPGNFPMAGNLLNPTFENYTSLSGHLPYNPSGSGYGPDWLLLAESTGLQSGAGYFNASLNIGVQPYRDLLCILPANNVSSDSGFAGAPGNEGDPSGVPEPDTMMLLGSGLLALAGIGRRFTRT